ncbi:MAG: lipopolysaccharide heptosyltransferase II [Oryzomonas sp.]|uniref:lipopolysaccharide heptosyltransferase II n=1 Tax=Oryzomonas sp. TaxID=2855186 RepID=UPI00285039A0|nr:lipopolysaccharide heptosyltransferase II [Oryzomonas sp.]MDR3579869.1 lipopolysaccharide heptosyltransferase II [Oryzomonas sp.]
MTKILLVRLSSLGDILLTTPAIRALKERYPDCRIDVAVYDRFAAALAHHPDIGRQLVVPKKELKAHLRRGELCRFWRLFREVVSALRSIRYDYVIDLHNVTDSALVVLLARGRTKVGHRRQLLSLFFSVRSSFDIGFASAAMHAAETNLRFLVDAGCLDERDLPKSPRLEFYGPVTARGEVDDYLVQQGLQGKTLVGINPCASNDFKRWGADRFAAVADYLAETYGYTVLVFGSPSERPIVQQAMAAMKNRAVDTSSLSLSQAFELIGRLRLFVTNDSAPMHIAAAMGTPLVALHGPINVKKFYPLADSVRSISKDIPCLPCKDIASCRSRICFDQVTVAEVCEACRDLLASLPEVQP